MTDHDWSCRNITRLYGLEPKGLGTGQIESLQSYLLSLAHAHSVAPSQLVHRVLHPMSKNARNPIVMGTSWSTESGRGMLGATAMVDEWLHILQTATGRTDLSCTTLRPLSAHINGEGIFAENSRHCPECLQLDILSGGETYTRLLWHMRDVKCCPLHKVNLVESCCGEATRPADRSGKRLGGVCPSCGSIGYACIKSSTSAAGPSEVWTALQYAALLQQAAQIESINPIEVKSAIRTYAQKSDHGIAGMARRADMAKSSLWRWVNSPSARFSLAGFTKIAAAEGWSLAGVLKADVAKVGTLMPIRIPRGRPVSHMPSKTEVDTRLARAAHEHISIDCLAEELRVSRAYLCCNFKKPCEEIVRNSTLFRKSVLRKIRTSALAEAIAVLIRLWEIGKPPTLRNAELVTANPWFPSRLRSRYFGALRTEFGVNTSYLTTKSMFNLETELMLGAGRAEIRRKIGASESIHLPMETFKEVKLDEVVRS